MPKWTTNVPTDPRGQGLPLIRTPAARSLRAIVTSPDLIGCETHYWGGHTVPCEAPECDACENGISYRWHGYLSAFNPDDSLHFIFEMTAQAAHIFAKHRQEHGTLRNCAFEAYRWKHSRNGRVMIKCEVSGMFEHALPQPPDLARIMAIIWRLPIPNVEQVGKLRGHPRVHASSHGDGQSRDLRDYEEYNPHDEPQHVGNTLETIAQGTPQQKGAKSA